MTIHQAAAEQNLFGYIHNPSSGQLQLQQHHQQPGRVKTWNGLLTICHGPILATFFLPLLLNILDKAGHLYIIYL